VAEESGPPQTSDPGLKRIEFISEAAVNEKAKTQNEEKRAIATFNNRGTVFMQHFAAQDYNQQTSLFHEEWHMVQMILGNPELSAKIPKETLNQLQSLRSMVRNESDSKSLNIPPSDAEARRIQNIIIREAWVNSRHPAATATQIKEFDGHPLPDYDGRWNQNPPSQKATPSNHPPFPQVVPPPVQENKPKSGPIP